MASGRFEKGRNSFWEVDLNDFGLAFENLRVLVWMPLVSFCGQTVSYAALLRKFPARSWSCLACFLVLQALNSNNILTLSLPFGFKETEANESDATPNRS